ncbi:hypothetical protein QQZ08_004381 [Neonectria magnoliae]|uniref:RNA helicase n=1 Tax=Neonectria magnoliae TaxID=2732573 RepID=A0ABR1I8K2_9HYPO
MASIIVTLLCLNEDIRQVFVSAPSNVATDNILDRVGTISTETIDKLITTNVPTKQLMLLRGYNQRHEMDNCMDNLGGKTTMRTTTGAHLLGDSNDLFVGGRFGPSGRRSFPSLSKRLYGSVEPPPEAHQVAFHPR